MFPADLFPLALGTAPFGTAIGRDTAFAILDAFLALGGNLIDTAAVYGMGASEQTIGDWLKDRRARDKITVATKGCHPSIPDWQQRLTEQDVRADLEASLRNLQTDYIDVYFLHRDDPSKPVEDIMPMLHKLVCEGKVQHLGASNWTVERIEQANDFAKKNGMTEFCVSQIFWNGARINKQGVYDQTLVVMDEEQHAGYAKNSMPVMAYTAQAQGLFSQIRDKGYERLSESMVRTYLNETTKARAARILQLSGMTGVSPTALSLAYLLYDRDVTAYPILGISRLERLQEALQIFTLDQNDLAPLFE
ncbi:MAG: aldo/keto reductase [Clostridia bacterium]|nr:aldo/keto reductase [Clostridia bacterium]